MTDKPDIDWSKIPPNIPYLRERAESGHGTWSVTECKKDDGSPGPIIIMHGVSMEEMERMGAAERERLGFEASYQFGLAHPPHGSGSRQE